MPPTPIGPPAPITPGAPALSPRGSFGEALRSVTAAVPRAPQAPAHPARAALESIENARVRLDAALAAARRGQTFTAPELLALQADAHRFAHAVELASKVVEGGAQAVKQAVNTQV